MINENIKSIKIIVLAWFLLEATEFYSAFENFTYNYIKFVLPSTQMYSKLILINFPSTLPALVAGYLLIQWSVIVIFIFLISRTQSRSPAY